MDRPQPLFGYFCQCLICSLCCKRVSFYGPTSDSFCSFLFEPRANHLGSFSYTICHWIVKLTKKERGRGWPFYKKWRCYWRHWMSLHFPVICTVKTNLLSCHFTHVVGNKNFIEFSPWDSVYGALGRPIRQQSLDIIYGRLDKLRQIMKIYSLYAHCYKTFGGNFENINILSKITENCILITIYSL